MTKPKTLSELYFEYERDKLEYYRSVFASRVIKPIISEMTKNGILPKGTFSVKWDDRAEESSTEQKTLPPAIEEK